MKQFSLLICFSLALACGIPEVTLAQEIFNDDFEASVNLNLCDNDCGPNLASIDAFGCASNWAASHGSPHITNFPAPENRGLRFFVDDNTSNDSEGAFANIQFEVGQSYQICFKMRAEQAHVSFLTISLTDNLTHFDNDNNFDCGEVPPTVNNEQIIFRERVDTVGEWLERTTTFTADFSYGQIWVRPQYSNGSVTNRVSIDEITIVEVPNPTLTFTQSPGLLGLSGPFEGRVIEIGNNSGTTIQLTPNFGTSQYIACNYILLEPSSEASMIASFIAVDLSIDSDICNVGCDIGIGLATNDEDSKFLSTRSTGSGHNLPKHTEVKIYPNPSSMGQLNVEFKEPHDLSTPIPLFQLYSLDGKLLYEKQLISKTTPLDVSHLNIQGMLIAKIQLEEEIVTKKIFFE